PEHDQQVVDEIRGLGDQPLAILADRGEHGLDRFLAKLPGAVFHSAVEQPARVGDVCACSRALFYTAFEIVQLEIGHGLALPGLHITSGPAAGERCKLARLGCPSGPIPKFASAWVTFRCELRNLRTTSNFMILVRFLNLKFLNKLAASNDRNFKFTALVSSCSLSHIPINMGYRTNEGLMK